jgi:hypothetical protein
LTAVRPSGREHGRSCRPPPRTVGNDCHTHPSCAQGWNPFLGQPEQINADQYLSGGRVFGPVAVSRNLTPDHTGKPAGLTFEEFGHLLRTGQDPDASGKLLQVMPWPVYGKMTDLEPGERKLPSPLGG